MRFEYSSGERLKKKIITIVSRHLDGTTYRLFFLGSCVAGGFSPEFRAVAVRNTELGSPPLPHDG